MIHLTERTENGPALLAVKVPEGAYELFLLQAYGFRDELRYYHRTYWFSDKDHNYGQNPVETLSGQVLPAGTWSLMGTLRQVWESDALAVACGFESGAAFRTFIREHRECLNEGFLATPDQWAMLIASATTP